MESQDFEMPSPKRQRTNSPAEVTTASTTNGNTDIDLKTGEVEHNDTKLPTADNETRTLDSDLSKIMDADEPDMLDVLMQHVEAESLSAQTKNQIPASVLPAVPGLNSSKPKPQGIAGDFEMEDSSIMPVSAQKQEAEQEEPGHAIVDSTAQAGTARNSQHQPDTSASSSSLTPGLEATAQPVMQHLHDAAETEGLPPTADALVDAHVPPTTIDSSIATDSQATATEPQAREWETDSSAYESSTDSSDTSSDSSEDDDEADEYTLLDPYEQARILMAEDGGGGDHSEDEDGHSRATNRGGGGGAGAGAGFRTANEKVEDILPKPDIAVTQDTIVEELGTVESVVENILLIKATVSGEYQVLESGSVLCLGPPSRNVIGVVAETLGRVQQPMYTVRFASDTDVRETFNLNAEDERNQQIKDTKIFYIKDHSTFVFTQPLKAVKGSDASNFHDEEVGDDEMEFSDDEAEAEHKRQMKLRRKGIDPSSHQGGARGQRAGRGQRGNRGGFGSGRGSNYSHNYNNARGIPESDTASMYSNTNTEMNYDDVEEGETSTDYTPLRRPETIASGQMSPPSHQQSQHNSTRGGHPRGNRPPRGRGNSNRGNTYQPNRTNNYISPTSTTSMYHQPYFPSNPQQTAYFGFQPPPPAPHITPFMSGTNTVPMSPMTPLPSAGPNGGAFTFALPDQAQAQAQNQWAQYHANLQQAQFGNADLGTISASLNAEALAQVQRQLEDLRRHTQGQG